jgi:hypothetical protein
MRFPTAPTPAPIPLLINLIVLWSLYPTASLALLAAHLPLGFGPLLCERVVVLGRAAVGSADPRVKDLGPAVVDRPAAEEDRWLREEDARDTTAAQGERMPEGRGG